jgi:hypothetical protein
MIIDVQYILLLIEKHVSAYIQIQGIYWILYCAYLKVKFTLQIAALSSRHSSGTDVRTYTRCRVSAMKRPDFIVQGVYNETP